MIAPLDLPTLDVRARGLSARLFSRAELEAMAAAPTVPALAREIDRRARWPVPIETPATGAAIESATRHAAAHHLRILSAWAGAGPALDVFYADQDRRSLRALFRGALQAAPADARLAGLLASPRLPERALTALAREPTPAQVAAHLVILGYPDAAQMSALATRAHPVLLDLERSLVRGFTERSLTAARAGDRNLRSVVRARVDVCNMQMALAVAAGPHDAVPATLYTAGGTSLTREAFLDACAATSSGEASLRMRKALAGTALRDLGPALGSDPARLEAVALARSLSEQRKIARTDPLGSAPLVRYLLLLQAQTIDLQRLAWGATLGAPGEQIRSGLVTPWS